MWKIGKLPKIAWLPEKDQKSKKWRKITKNSEPKWQPEG